MKILQLREGARPFLGGMKVQKWTVEDWKTKAENTGKRLNQAEYVACMMRQAALGLEQKVQSEASANQYGQSRLAEANT